jgi:hypothetical protein
LIKSIQKGLDIKDFLVFGGLAILGYGLWLKAPWLGFSVVGASLMLIGYFVEGE